MSFMYRNMINNQNSLIESPTGTGKSLVMYAVIEKYLNNQGKDDIATKNQSKPSRIPSWLMQEARINLVNQINNQKEEIIQLITTIQQIQYFPADNIQNWLEILGSMNELDVTSIITLKNLLSFQYKSQHKQVIFASRTHQQLEQFQQQLQELNSVTLASRQQYCIHHEKADIEDIDYFCKNNQCIHKKPERIIRGLVKIVGHSFSRTETLVKCLESSSCPYYCTQIYSNLADVILITHQQIGEAANEEAVLVCDEAHNLVEIIQQKSSSELNVVDCSIASQKIEAYIQKAQIFLKLDQLESLKIINNQLKKVIILSQYMFSNSMHSVSQEKLGLLLKQYDVNKIILKEINIFLEQRFVHRIRQKVDERLFYKCLQLLELFSHVELMDSFLLIVQQHLTANEAENYIIEQMPAAKLIDKTGYQLELKLHHLRPKQQLKYKSIHLLGGTLAPFEAFERYFINNFEKIAVGHVISRNNFQCIIRNKVNHKLFKFNAELQKQITIFEDILIDIMKARQSLPASQNMIVFMPNYSSQKQLVGYLKNHCYQNEFGRDQLTPSVYQQENKVVFTIETPKTPLEFYQKAVTIENHILFGVAGASLAEGIDFKDDLCRLLIIIGIPYPNIGDSFIQEMQNINPDFSQMQAFKKVNQCIGRAIRWVGDWATVELWDERYISNQKQLSFWIRDIGVKISEQ